MKRERNYLGKLEVMRWNKREILLAGEWEKALFNENQSVVFTHKPNCLSEPYEVFEMKKIELESFTLALIPWIS